jgi:hypothetical protein
LPPTEAINTRAIRTNEKNSKGPNFVEQSAMGFANNSKNTHETRPPINDAVTPRPNARPGLPDFAIGYPSKVVMMDAGVPGILNKVAVISPPLTDPTYIDTNRINADSPLIENVRGKVRAINIAPVNPGMAPTMIPRLVPTAISSRELGVKSN